MIGTGSPPKDFGDYLGEYLANGAAATKTIAAAPEPRWRNDFDKSLVKIAKAVGEDPSAVLEGIHKDEPLARVFREVMGVNIALRPISDAVKTYIIAERFKAAGLVGNARDCAVAAELNSERDAAGNRLRTIDKESVRKAAKRGERQFASQMAKLGGGLAGFFTLR